MVCRRDDVRYTRQEHSGVEGKGKARAAGPRVPRGQSTERRGDDARPPASDIPGQRASARTMATNLVAAAVLPLSRSRSV